MTINYQTGKIAALVTAASTFVFAIAMLLPNEALSSMISYSICILLSWGYLSTVCAFIAISEEKDARLYIALSFAVLYALFICFVYFTQLTTVLNQAASKDILNALTYTPGSFSFAFDLFGYGMLSISTIFLGLSIKPETQSNKWFRYLLLGHGSFAPFCILLPIIDVFGSMSESSGANIGIMVLEIWCVIFIPIMLFAAKYFRQQYAKLNQG